MISLRYTHDCSSVLISVHCTMTPGSWVFMTAHECSWGIVSHHEHPLGLKGTHKQPRPAIIAHDCSWALMRSHEHLWARCHESMSTHKSSTAVMGRAPGGRGHNGRNSTILMSAQECSWSLMCANERSQEIMRAHECWHGWWNNKRKMFTFRITSL